jgi:SsrA-binding protein
LFKLLKDTRKGGGTKAPGTENNRKVLGENRKARFDYHIIERFEAGLVLSGAEIQSVRRGGMSIQESYVRPQNGEVFLLGAHISKYEFSGAKEYDPLRPRKLLLKRSEIEKLAGAVERKGLTVVPLTIYLKNGFAKVEVALAKGKDAPDKRDAIKKREANREASRALRRNKS